MSRFADNRLCLITGGCVLFAHQDTQCKSKLEIEIDEYPRNLGRINLDMNQAIELCNFLNEFIGAKDDKQ